ncbi:hypothetical protein N018_05300 [Pseudomonas syringae CC1557]|uniref:Uncharacterized protein n=1 Tax=Pseudomonas syringae CC1557 TaxID=1357279 RepID=W0MSC2_PSESX|nr:MULTISPECIES: hypothetical protein [Pseudomonas syringae group]AHG39691.1 hypothetical protein N018_05300 [Pseudomonas syringae CC1557]RMR32230.1 hypothetical protein ALP87_00340 [Pseudomonas syringae pv. coriandricola]
MAKTVLHARQDGVQFYMNTESSSPGTGHRNRYRLFKTENFGRDKSGWVQIGSQVGQQLIAMEDGGKRFEACAQAFSEKRPHMYQERERIRGNPGNWEGEAFPTRVTRGRDAAVSATDQNLTSQEGRAT